MGTQKLKAIGRIISSRNYILISSDGEDVKTMAHEIGSLEEAILVTTSLSKVYKDFKNQIEAQAVEAGELNTLMAFRDAFAKMEKDMGNGGN